MGGTHRNLSNWYIDWQASTCMTLLNEIRLQSVVCNNSHKWRLVHRLSFLYKKQNTCLSSFPTHENTEDQIHSLFPIRPQDIILLLNGFSGCRIECPAHTLFIFSVCTLISCLWNTFQCKIRGKSKSGFCLDFEMGPQGRSLLSCHHPYSTAQKFSQIPQSKQESKRKKKVGRYSSNRDSNLQN